MEQSNKPQPNENTTAKAGDKATDHHLMPGLIDPLCDAFDNPRRHLTTRGVARQKRIAETFVISALLRDTRNELFQLRGMLARIAARKPDNVREFRVMTGGRSAA